MFRLSAPLLISVAALNDETSLMQGVKPTQVTQKVDKTKAIDSLLSTATSMLKNGATPDVVDFAQATLTEITSAVLPAINDAHAADQLLVDNTFTMFEAALAELETNNIQVKMTHDEERRHSALHKACRAEEEIACGHKRDCDYELWAIWRRFVEEESILRQLSTEISHHFCAEDANGTMFIFRDHSVTLFPPWLEQKPIVERWEVEYDDLRPHCEHLFIGLDDKTAECDAHQANLDAAACLHSNTVKYVRVQFATAWYYAVLHYQRVVDEVHCLELDRWKEWRTLATVQCLLDRTTERNGRPCDDTTDEVVTEVARCEEIQVTESIDHLRIIYHIIPVKPDWCATPPWEVSPAVVGRCVPVHPTRPCNAEYIEQEYAELWIPPQPVFHEENSHCNQRPECIHCEWEPEPAVCGVVYTPDFFPLIYPAPEHECHPTTRAHLDTGLVPGIDIAPQYD